MLPRRPSLPRIGSHDSSPLSDRTVAAHRLVAAASSLDRKQFDPDLPHPTKGLNITRGDTRAEDRPDSGKNGKDESKHDTKDDTKEDAKDDAKPETQATIENDTSPETKDERMHVVVEDNMVNQKVLTKQLRKADCVVTTADNGVWALKHLEKTKFRQPNGIPLSIILIDCEMPEMDGLTCCRKIREMEKNGAVKEHVPIIAVTANIRGGQLDDAKESGMDEVIGKPFRIPDLLGKMKGLLKKLEEGKES
jgi:CheY-like chemotaxis protein